MMGKRDDADKAWDKAVKDMNEAGKAWDEAGEAWDDAHKLWDKAYRARAEAYKSLDDHDKQTTGARMMSKKASNTKPANAVKPPAPPAIMSNKTTTAGNRYEYMEAGEYCDSAAWERVCPADVEFDLLYRRPIAQASEPTPAEAHGLVVGGLYLGGGKIRRIDDDSHYSLWSNGKWSPDWRIGGQPSHHWGRLIRRDSEEAIRILGLMEEANAPWNQNLPLDPKVLVAELEEAAYSRNVSIHIIPKPNAYQNLSTLQSDMLKALISDSEVSGYSRDTSGSLVKRGLILTHTKSRGTKFILNPYAIPHLMVLRPKFLYRVEGEEHETFIEAVMHFSTRWDAGCPTPIQLIIIGQTGPEMLTTTVP